MGAGSFKFFRQHDKMDCGPACLRMVFKYHGYNTSAEKLRRESNLQKQGTSLLSISESAERYGFHCIAAKVSMDELLDESANPVILFWDQRHFVVLAPKSTRSTFQVADPAVGVLNLTKKDFLGHWICSSEDGQMKGIALFLNPVTRLDDTDDQAPAIGWSVLLRYLSPYRAQVAQLLLTLLLGSLLQLVFPFLAQSVVDVGITTQNLNFIQLVLIAQFTLFFSRTVVEFLRSRLLLFISTHVNLAVLSEFWIKLMSLPLDYFDSKQTGDIIQRIGDHKRIESFITGTALMTMFSMFNLLVFSVTLFLYSFQIFGVFLCGSLLYFAWIAVFLKYRRTIDYRQFDLGSKENTLTLQLIQGMQEIKLNNAEQIKRWEWENIQASTFNLNTRSLFLNQYQQSGAFFLNEGKNIVITYLVAVMVLEGSLSLGVMLAIQYIIAQLNSPVEQLINFTRQAQDAKISLERLNEVHQMPSEKSCDRLAVNHLGPDSGILFSNVRFGYPGSDVAAVNGISLEFESGKTTAIVGMSGHGKTTMLKLIQKFYNSYDGEIRIGSAPLKHLDPFFWRSISGSVMQDGFIFSDTIERNIVLGELEPDATRLIHACRVANILDLVESLPMGFNTKIGAEGHGLSAGQRQRILIARVVYKNPQFVFFDEATNALDAQNEKVIMENLTNFFKGKTVVVVAHRLSTVKNADKIVVIEQGKITEQGNHAELVTKQGSYYQLVKNQLELGN